MRIIIIYDIIHRIVSFVILQDIIHAQSHDSPPIRWWLFKPA